MADKIVTWETAVAAHQAGFNEPTMNHWERGIDGRGWGLFTSGDLLRNDELTSMYISDVPEICGEFSAPTLYELQGWIRETLHIHIMVFPDDNNMHYPPYKMADSWSFMIRRGTIEVQSGFKTYEEALEAGLKYALTIKEWKGSE